MNAVATLPLAGITVVALEQAIAAPLATRHLADWGARVIKVERTEGGDFCRDYDKVMAGMSSQFVWTNRSKESLALDLKSEKGRTVLEALISKADVFIQNLAPGAAGRMGVDGTALLTRYPRLIACDISGYGSSGPFASKKAYDLLVQCEAGVLDINGTVEQPAKAGISIVDIATGMYALNGILMALFQRERTGKGLAFEVSLFDAIAEWMSYPAYFRAGAGRSLQRTGMRHASIAPYGPFRVGDGNTIFFGIQNDREWQAFCEKVLAQPDLAHDQRFATNPQRFTHAEALVAVIEARFASMNTPELGALLEAAGIANARLNSVEQFLDHPQLHERGRITEVDTPCGPVMSFFPPFIAAGMQARMGRVPALGEHNATILAELGFNEGRP